MAATKQRLLNVDSFLKTLESTNGRDKLGKLIQYTARLSAWYLNTYTPQDTESIARASGVQKGVATARKLTRLLKWWPLIIKVKDSLSTKGLNQPIAEVLRHFSSLGLANYFFWDGVSWAIGVGLIKGDNAKFSKWSMYGWFFGLVFAILVDTLESIKVARSCVANQNGDAQKSAQNQAACQKLTLNYVKNISDLCISAKGIQLVDFSEGWLGLCGILAALVGFYELWPLQ